MRTRPITIVDRSGPRKHTIECLCFFFGGGGGAWDEVGELNYPLVPWLPATLMTRFLEVLIIMLGWHTSGSEYAWK